MIDNRARMSFPKMGHFARVEHHDVIVCEPLVQWFAPPVFLVTDIKSGMFSIGVANNDVMFPLLFLHSVRDEVKPFLKMAHIVRLQAHHCHCTFFCAM